MKNQKPPFDKYKPTVDTSAEHTFPVNNARSGQIIVWVAVAVSVVAAVLAVATFALSRSATFQFGSSTSEELFRDEDICFETNRLDENGNPIERCIHLSGSDSTFDLGMSGANMYGDPDVEVTLGCYDADKGVPCEGETGQCSMFFSPQICDNLIIDPLAALEQVNTFTVDRCQAEGWGSKRECENACFMFGDVCDRSEADEQRQEENDPSDGSDPDHITVINNFMAEQRENGLCSDFRSCLALCKQTGVCIAGDETLFEEGIPDIDNDGVSDADEVQGASDTTDTDGDGTPDNQDEDIDGDGESNSIDLDPEQPDELPQGDGPKEDLDGDGIPNEDDLIDELPNDEPLPEDFYSSQDEYLSPRDKGLLDKLREKEAWEAFKDSQELYGEELPDEPPAPDSELGRELTDFTNENYSDLDAPPPVRGDENYGPFLDSERLEDEGAKPGDPAPSTLERIWSKIKTFFKNLFSTPEERAEDAAEAALNNEDTYTKLTETLDLQEEGLTPEQNEPNFLDKIKLFFKNLGKKIGAFVKDLFTSDEEALEDEFDAAFDSQEMEDFQDLFEEEGVNFGSEKPVDFSKFTDLLKKPTSFLGLFKKGQSAEGALSVYAENPELFFDLFGGTSSLDLNQSLQEDGAIPLPPGPETVDLSDVYQSLADQWNAYEKEQEKNYDDATNPYVYTNADLPGALYGTVGDSSVPGAEHWSQPGELVLIDLKTGATIIDNNDYYYNEADMRAKWVQLQQQYGENPALSGWTFIGPDKKPFNSPDALARYLKRIREQRNSQTL